MPTVQHLNTPSLDEKDQPVHIEHGAAATSLESAGVDKKFEKRTIRRVDFRLLPILGAMYSISLIDRNNFSLARVAGMDKDLELKIDNRYSILLLLFFVPYFIFELPSNLALRKVGAANWLASIAMVWGAVMIGMGFVTDWKQMAVCRTLLGFFEAGFFPGCAYLIQTWYIRREVQTRMAAFYLTSVLAGGFAKILGYGLSQMEGTAGIRGWRWIFIIEGVMTCAIGLLSWFLIVDFPDKSTFLSVDQKACILERIERDRGDSVADKFRWKEAFAHLGDWKLWAFALMFMGSTSASYAYSYFLPPLLKGMGYSTKDSQVLSAPPYVVAVAVAFTLAWYADRINKRSPIIITQAMLSIIGLLMTAYISSNGGRYAGVFLGLSGCSGNVPAVLAWKANSIVGQSKRAMASALVVGFGAIGGIYASTVFREQDAPAYVIGLWATMGCQFMIILLSLSLVFFFAKENRKAEREGHIIEKQPGFRYTL